MFTVRKRHGSMVSLNNNPQLNQKISQQKLHRFQKQTIKQIQLQQKSSRILPKLKPIPIPNSQTESKLSDTKKQQKNQVKNLSLAINKYYLSRSQHAKSSQFNELSLDIMSVLHHFSQIQNNFQELFQFIHSDLMKFMFMSENSELMAKYGIKQGEMYKKVVEDIDCKVTKKMKEVYERLREATDEKDEIKLEYQRYTKVWQTKQKKHNEQIQFYKKISNRQYTTYLQQKLSQRQQRIQQLQQSQRSLVLLRDQYQKEMQKQTDTIDEQLGEIVRLKNVVNDLKTGKEESERLIVKLRDRFDQVSVKIMGIKEIIDVVQEENQMLKTERSGLVKRAAVTFDELTPRPKYGKMISFTEKQSTKAMKSTEQITELLLIKIGSNINTEKFRLQLLDETKEKNSKQRQMHPKLQQADNIRQSTLGLIIQSKEELKRVGKMLAKIER